jgi:hypothetical protein
MPRFVLLALSACSFVLFPSVDASADTVELRGGGQITGQVVRKPDWVIVKVDDEVQVAIQPSRVIRVVTSDQLQKYRSKVIEAGNDAELHYQLGIWCVTDDNVPGDSQHYRRYHMQRAIELDPDHAQARASLGYKKHEGKWVRTRDLMRDRGMISRGTGWELPEAVAIEDFQDANNVESKKWIREVNRLTKSVLIGSAKSQESLEALQAINDPLAAEAIARQLSESRGKTSQSRPMRLLWVKLLGQFQNSISVQALVITGIDEQDATVREAALEQLLKYGSGSAVATYLPMLKSNDNQLVNRAARALSWFPDPELALTYVDALVTTHTKQIAGGPGMQAGFDDQGGGGLAMGGKPKVIKTPRTNPAVYTLVKLIEPDVDHGYDEKAWQLHFANKRTAFSGDLRRDP